MMTLKTPNLTQLKPSTMTFCNLSCIRRPPLGVQRRVGHFVEVIGKSPWARILQFQGVPLGCP